MEYDYKKMLMDVLQSLDGRHCEHWWDGPSEDEPVSDFRKDSML